MDAFRERQQEAIARWLRVFLAPGQVAELRALEVGGAKAVCRIYDDPEAMARDAADLDTRGAKGVYFTLNPLRPDLAGSRASARKADVARRHWLPIDCDPVRPANLSATEAERAAAWRVLLRCRGILDGVGLKGAVVGDSSNGWHLCYPIDLPSDDAAHALIRDVLIGLASRCDDPLTDAERDAAKAGRQLPAAKASVDPKTHDAPRIWKCYGTRARKGASTPERPHRWTRLVEGQPWQEEVASLNTSLLARMLEHWRRQDDLRRGRPELSTRTYALAALGKECGLMASAPAGSRNDQLNRSAFAVGQLVQSGGLSWQEAYEGIWEAARRAGCDSPQKDADTITRGLKAGMADLRDLSAVGNGTNGHPSNGHSAAASPTEERSNKTEAEPWEDPIPLEEECPAAPFPLEVLPPTLRRFVNECSWALSCPLDFLAVPLLVAAGAAIGNSARLVIKEGHTQGAVLFAAVVGLASSGKSPALEMVAEPLELAQRHYFAEYQDAMQAWQASGSDGSAPTPRQVLADEVTAEALLLLLQDNPRGVLMVRDEMAALVSGLNQYKDGKGNDRQLYLKLWPQATVKVHRVRMGSIPLRVYRPFVGIVGGIQPSVIAQMRAEQESGKASVEDGFLDRFLFAYPDPMPAVGEQWREVSREAIASWETAVNRLLSLHPPSGGESQQTEYPRLDPDGRLAWKEFTDLHATELNDPDFPPHLSGPWGKLRGYCGRLALVLHLLREVCDEPVERAVDAESVRRASLLIDYFKDHARRVYRAMGADPRTVTARKVLRWVRTWDGKTFSRRDLWRSLRRQFGRPEEMEQPLKLLQHLHHIRPVQVQSGGPGRPATDCYEINPRTLEHGDNGDKTTSLREFCHHQSGDNGDKT